MASVLLLDVEPARLRLHTQTQRAKRLAGNLSLPWSPRPGATCATLISLLLDALTLGGAGTSYGVAQRKIGSPGLPEKNMACNKHCALFSLHPSVTGTSCWVCRAIVVNHRSMPRVANGDAESVPPFGGLWLPSLSLLQLSA